MAYISKLTVAGVTYDIYDAEVRELISKVLVFAGVTSVVLSDGDTTPSTYADLTGISTPYPIDPSTGQPHAGTDTVDSGTVVLSNSKEFVWDGSKWVEFGDLSDLSLNPTYGNFLISATASPTNTAANTGAGSAHSHSVSATTQHLGLTKSGTYLEDSSQSATIQSQVAIGTLSATSGTGTGDGLIASLNTSKLATSSPYLAVAGTAVPVFNSIDSNSTDGIKIITEVSGGGQAGEVTTSGIAAAVAPNVVIGLATSNATATGRIAYTAGVTTTNKMVTASVTPASVGTAVDVVTGFSTTGASAAGIKGFRYLQKGLQSVTQNSDGTNTYTLTILSEVCNGVTASSAVSYALNSDSTLMYDAGYLTLSTSSITPAKAGTQITYATGSLSNVGSGSAVATGGTTSYLYANTSSQTANVPTVVSFGTVVINGTPSYIHTSNIVPAVASSVTFATGLLAANGAGGTVVTGGTTKYMTLGAQSITLASSVAAIGSSGQYVLTDLSLNTSTASATGTVSFVKSVSGTTGVESAHTHSYSKTTAISLSTSSASALTSVTLTTASA